MRATDDGFARARRALRQVDDELDLARLRAVTSERISSEATTSKTTISKTTISGQGPERTSGRDRSGTDLPPLDESVALGVEILRTGQRPALPRRRATAWALAAAVALLCGAGVGTAVLWPEPGGTAPGSQVPASPAPWTSPGPDAPDQVPDRAPDVAPTTGPRECDLPGTAPSSATDRLTDAAAPDACEPTPEPSARGDRTQP